MPPYRTPLCRALRSSRTASLVAVFLFAGWLALSGPASAQPASDLALVSVALRPSVARVGDVVTAFVTVRNAGGRATDPSTVDLLVARLGNNSPDGVSTLGTIAVDTLAPGASVQLSLSFTVPAIAPGFLNVTAQADSRNRLAEAYESNNRGSRLLEVTRPDLMVAAISLSQVARANDNVNAVVTVRNIGRVPADASRLGLSLITNPSAIEGGIGLGSWPVAPLAAGASVQIPVAFTVPAVAPGSFYVVARADVAADVAETLDNNNHRLAFFQVALPDLLVDYVSVTPSTARAGDVVRLQLRVRNQGRVPAEASEGAVYLVTSPASVLEGATPLLTFRVARLASGESAQTTLSLPVPFATPGSFMVVARADSTGVLSEASKSNNLRAAGLQISAPNLTIAGFTVTPAAVGVGETIRAVLSLQNRSLVASHPTTATLYLATDPNAELSAATYATTVPVPTVGPYRTVAVNAPIVVPNLPEGNQYLIVQVDAATANSAMARAEASLTPVLAALANNPRSAARFTLRHADLVVSGLGVSAAQVRPGESVTVTMTVVNQGSGAAPASTAGVFLVSGGGGATEGLTPVATVAVSPLAPRSAALHRVTLPVAAESAGAYTLIVEADWPKAVPESDEANNRAAAQLQIAGSPGSGGPVELEPLIDPSQLEMPWPKHSHYKQPWKAWLETIPAQTFIGGLGISYNWNAERANHDVQMQLLADVGFSRIRVEVGWSNVDYDTLDLTPVARARLTSIARAARTHGIRPLILLNANHGIPGPARGMTRTVAATASTGSRTLRLDAVTDIRTRYTGLSYLAAGKMAEVLVTAVDASTRTVTLSKPLPVSLSAGQEIALHTLRYQPLSNPGTAEFEETMAGWIQYARTVLGAVTAAGVSEFDVEIWNELTFGSDYLHLNRYYDPPLIPEQDYLQPGGRAWELARRTADMMAAEFPQALPIWGFSNITFFGVDVVDLPPRVRGQSYHPYMFVDYRSVEDEQYGFAQNLEQFAPRTPPYRVLMPEAAGTYLKTESLARLINPTTRQRRPSLSPSFGHFMTEFGFNPGEWDIEDANEAEVIKAKTLLRASLFWLNKGLKALWFFSDIHDGSLGSYDLLPAWAADLTSYPADPDSVLSLPLRVLRNVSALFKDSAPVTPARQIEIEAAADDGHGGGIAFAGSVAHPSLTYQDVLAALPFQRNARTFIVAFYTMSRNILQATPDTSFVVRLSNVSGTAAQLRYTNPLTGTDLPVELVERTPDALVVRLPVSDSPRLLVISED